MKKKLNHRHLWASIRSQALWAIAALAVAVETVPEAKEYIHPKYLAALAVAANIANAYQKRGRNV